MAKKKETRRFGTEIGGNLFPDAEQVAIEEVLDADILVKDFTILTGEFGEYVIINYTSPEEVGDFSTACGGIVVLKKLREAKEKGLLPLLGCITKSDRYYDIA